MKSTRYTGIPIITAAFLSLVINCSHFTPAARRPADVRNREFSPYVKSQSQMQKILLANQSGFLSMVVGESGSVSQMRKWIVYGKRFTEAGPTSSNDEINWFAESVDLNLPLPARLWFGPVMAEEARCSFRQISELSFEILCQDPSGIQLVAYVFPARPNPFAQDKVVSFEHMNAPVANASGTIFAGDGLHTGFKAPEASTVLRHDLAKQRSVFVDESFPPEFEPSLLAAIKEWNLAYRREFYGFAGRRSLDVPTCLMENSLCLFWQGSNKLAVSGYGGVTMNAYDPQTGEIRGGIIRFFNANNLDPLAQLPEETKTALSDGQAVGSHLDLLARISIAVDRRGYASPDPAHAVTAVLLHEMGHEGGMRHYFAGSLHRDPARNLISDTVMDYVPAGAMPTMLRLGRRDLAKVNEIYFRGPAVTEIHCSDGDVIVDPYCKPQDVGPTEDWLMRLSQFAPQGILTPYSEVGGLLMILNGLKARPLFMHLAQFVLPSVQMPTLPPGLPKTTRRQITENYRQFQGQLRTQLAGLHRNVSETTSQKVKNYLCEAHRLKLIRQAASADDFKFVDQACHGVEIQ